MWSTAQLNCAYARPKRLDDTNKFSTLSPNTLVVLDFICVAKDDYMFYFVWNILKPIKNPKWFIRWSNQHTHTQRKTLPRKWWFYCHACLLQFFCLSKWARQKEVKKVPCHLFYGHFIRLKCDFIAFFEADRLKSEKKNRTHSMCEKNATRKKRFISWQCCCVHTPFFGTRVNQTIMLKLNESIFFVLLLLLWYFVYVYVSEWVSVRRCQMAQINDICSNALASAHKYTHAIWRVIYTYTIDFEGHLMHDLFAQLKKGIHSTIGCVNPL